MRAGGLPKARALVVLTQKWVSTGQLISALTTVGFQVAIVCPAKSPIRKLKNIDARYNYRRWRSQTSIKTAISAWSPDLLICADDIAVRDLHRIHLHASVEVDRPQSKSLAELVELSLGSGQTFPTTRSKSELVSVARSLGIRCPSTTILSDNTDLMRRLEEVIYPVMVKMDESWSGRGVRLANNKDELLDATLELSFPHDWPWQLKRLSARLIRGFPYRWWPPLPKNMSIQQSVVGRPACRAVASWQGKILAGISIEALETQPRFGPTTIAKIIDHSEMTNAAEVVVNKLNLSGFLGFDFILGQDNRAWLLEMNPRVTPTCHLRTSLPSLPASLFAAITGALPHGDVRVLPHDTVAIFNSLTPFDYAHVSWPVFDDTPDGEPAFINACRNMEQRRFLYKFVRRWLSKTRQVKPGQVHPPIGAFMEADVRNEDQS
jgi:ATP-grasp domain-containing protein